MAFVAVKSEITPLRMGFTTVMESGLRPIISDAFWPTAKSLPVSVSNATALGSETTIPLPSTKIRIVVVPRSIPMFVPSIFRPPFWLLPR